MRKLASIIGSAVFLVIAPGFVAGLVPWWISRWRLDTPFLGLPPVRIVGAMLLTLGVIGLLDSFARFALKGEGTPAPVFHTRHLVVSGLYRYVRNPMYVSVVSAILGQALILGNMQLLDYGAFVWLAFHLFGSSTKNRCSARLSAPNTNPSAPTCPDGSRASDPGRPSRSRERERASCRIAAATASEERVHNLLPAAGGRLGAMLRIPVRHSQVVHLWQALSSSARQIRSAAPTVCRWSR